MVWGVPRTVPWPEQLFGQSAWPQSMPVWVAGHWQVPLAQAPMPEQLLGHVSAGADIYACGAVAREMLAGKRVAELELPPRM